MLTRSTLNDIVQHAQRTIAECTQFLCAGRAEFPEILQIFRPIFAQTLRDLDAGLARYPAFERMPTRERAATKFCGSRNHAGRVHANFCARSAPAFFGNFENFFARVRRKSCVIPTPDAFFFGSECNYDSINSQRRCGVCTAHAGRVHAIFVRGACRISGNFANFSRDFLRKICVISTLDSRVILH